ncbi:MAG: L,D-transpeptidase [Candidatus Moranbacteria bacterium]|nr:L,D-transpeptidase [Candidatus Moranbacteria bacterium]
MCKAFGYEPKEIHVYLKPQFLDLMENGEIIATYRIISGYDGPATSQDGSRTYYKPTPKETRRIISKTINGYSRKYDAEMPYAMQFKRGYYIHAWSWSEPLPAPGHGYATHGCISLDLPDAKFLFDWAPVGTIIYFWEERN